MLRRIFPFSTLTQFFAVGTNQLRLAARSLTLLPSRLVVFGMLPIARSDGHRRVARVGLDPVDGERLVGADRDGEIRAAEEAGHRLALGLARHHELRREALVLVADAAAEPARPDHRAGVALGVDVVRVGMRLVGRLAGPRAAVKKFLKAVRPAIAFGEASVPFHLPLTCVAIEPP